MLFAKTDMHITVMSWYSCTVFAIFILGAIAAIQVYDRFYAAETMEQRHDRRMREVLEKRERERQERMEMEQASGKISS